MIGPYVEKDPTAFCFYEDFLPGAETIERFCLLRAESARGQLEGRIPSTIRGQMEDKSSFIDVSLVWLKRMVKPELWFLCPFCCRGSSCWHRNRRNGYTEIKEVLICVRQ